MKRISISNNRCQTWTLKGVSLWHKFYWRVSDLWRVSINSKWNDVSSLNFQILSRKLNSPLLQNCTVPDEIALIIDRLYARFAWCPPPLLTYFQQLLFRTKNLRWIVSIVGINSILLLIHIWSFVCSVGICWWQDQNADLSKKIEQGFGPNGLGIISISAVRNNFSYSCCYFYF